MSTVDIFEDQKKSADLTVLLGVLALVAGVVALAWPGITLVTLSAAFGITVLCTGVAYLAGGIRGTGASTRAADVVLGVLGIVAGLVSLRHPGSTLIFLVIAAGSWLVASGLVDLIIGAAIELPGRGYRIAAGVVDVIAGVTILAWPSVGLATLALVVGFALAFKGVVLIAAGISFHRAASELTRDARDLRSELAHPAAR